MSENESYFGGNRPLTGWWPPYVIMEQFLIVIIFSGLNERMINIGIDENFTVWWKLCMYLGRKWVLRSRNGWVCYGKSPSSPSDNIQCLTCLFIYFKKLECLCVCV